MAICEYLIAIHKIYTKLHDFIDKVKIYHCEKGEMERDKT